jgi:hypothetical protein
LIDEKYRDNYSEQEIQGAKVFGQSFFRNVTRFVIKSGPPERDIIGKKECLTEKKRFGKGSAEFFHVQFQKPKEETENLHGSYR